jgi:hypothetical protein
LIDDLERTINPPPPPEPAPVEPVIVEVRGDDRQLPKLEWPKPHRWFT